MTQTKAILKYLCLTVKHKYFVLLAGVKIGTPLHLLIFHDLSKFRLSELPHYARQFYGSGGDSYGFITCWVRHQNRNPHHWEYWVPRTGHNRCTPPYKDMEPVDMPDKYISEMVADWIGASRAYEGKYPDRNWKWFIENFKGINVTAKTRKRILHYVLIAVPDMHIKE